MKPEEIFDRPFRELMRRTTRAAAWAHQGKVSRQSFVELAGILYDATVDVTMEMIESEEKEANA